MKSQANTIAVCLCSGLWSLKSIESSLVKVHSWPLSRRAGTVSEGPAVPGAAFPACCWCLCSLQGPNVSTEGSKPNLGLLQPQLGLTFGLWQQSQLCSEERLNCSWIFLLDPGKVSSVGQPWPGLIPSEIPNSAAPRSFCTAPSINEPWREIPEVSNSSQHRFCFSVYFYR